MGYKIYANNSFLLLFIFSCFIFSCNKPVNFEEHIGESNLSLTGKKKKVLLITIQGARGDVVKAAETPNIDQLLSHSIYSWDAVSDTNSSDYASLATLFTGVDNYKNGVNGKSYVGNNMERYPSFYGLIQEGGRGAVMLHISDVPSINDTLTGKGVTLIGVDTDDEVRDKAVDHLAKEDTVDILTVSFNEVNEVGLAVGFDPHREEYVKQIEKTDQYVGDLITALKERANYSREDWMIVIASNHGGLPDGTYGGDSFEERNGFILYNNASFSHEETKKPLVNVPYTGSFPFFQRAEFIDHAAYSESPVIDFSEDHSFTIEFNVKIEDDSQISWNTLVANKEWRYATKGWLVYVQNGIVEATCTGSGGESSLSNGPVINDQKWHHITLVFDRSGNIRAYENGKFYVEGASMADVGDLNGDYPFTVGTDGTLNYDQYNSEGGDFASLNGYIADVRIWNAALSDEAIEDWSFIPITQEHPNYDDLVVNWRLENGKNSDQLVGDRGPYGIDLTVLNGLDWVENTDVLNPSDIDETQFVPHLIDVPINILAWMGVRILPEYKLDGQLMILD